MDTSTPTSATGGSASSQAEGLDASSWQPHRGVAAVIRLAMFAVPVLAGMVAVRLTLPLLGRPSGVIQFVVWAAALIVLSTIAAMTAQRLTRRLAPLAALFKLSLAFPDEAPSRFRVAMRKNSGRSLARSVARSDAAPSAQQVAAERLVMLLAELGRHDRQTRGHSERVRAYSIMLGEEIGLSKAELTKLNWAALIHDIGKLRVDESILNKVGRPTESEWEELRTHPGASAGYIEPLRPWLGDWTDAALQHHERYDGGGYPLGLQGRDISLAGRIVAIADAFDVMTAARSYKKPLPPEQARAELLRNAGTQFDPTLVRAFLSISLGRMRWLVGPAGWLAHFPDLVRVPLNAAGSTGATVATIATVVVASAIGVVAPYTPDETAAPAPSAERLLADEEEPNTLEGPAVAGEPGREEEDSPTEAVTADPLEDPIAAPNLTLISGEAAAAPSSTTSGAPLANPTTSAAPTTTTGSPATTSSTTTTAPSMTDLSWFVGSAGAMSKSFLPLDGPLAAGPLANYDTDNDDEPGLLVQKGAGLSETNYDKMQQWFVNAGSGLSLVGTPRLDIWLATKDFDNNRHGRVAVGLYDCAANKTGCVALASGTGTFNQAAFGNDFGKVTITLGLINASIDTNRGLMLKVSPDDSGDHLWYAFANASYPSELTIS
ncbi:MAG: hypothetical protein ACI9C1_000287 [Candidatus Aldehydirespiratoraceae bacterium]